MAFRDKLKAILQINDTPHHIAMSFAFGVFWGMSPLLGIHTLGAFFTAWLLRLNRFVALVGVFITNPWTFVPIYTFSLWVGAKLMGIKQILPEVGWKSISLLQVMEWLKRLISEPKNFIDLITELLPLIKAFFIGSFAVGVVAAVLSYFIIYGLVVKYRKIKHHDE